MRISYKAQKRQGRDRYLGVCCSQPKSSDPGQKTTAALKSPYDELAETLT